MKDVVDNSGIDFLGFSRQTFQERFRGTPLSSGIRIFFREMLLHEFEKRLLRIRVSPWSFRPSPYGLQDRKTS